jgi:hypothetical protein
MDFATDNYEFDRSKKDRLAGNIIGWDEIRKFKIEVKNTRDIPVKVEIKRNFNTHAWDIKTKADYEKDDLNTIKFTVSLKPASKKVIEYKLTTYHGTRTDEWDSSR